MCITFLFELVHFFDMKCRKFTVRAREHHGTDSLDLTVPTILVREYDIQIGDVFEISVSSNKNELQLTYKRVYEQSKT